MTIGISTTELLKTAFYRMIRQVNTAIPGHVIDFDPTTCLAQLQIGVQWLTEAKLSLKAPPIIECPVFVYGGSEFSVEVELQAGDEGLIIFSQKCIDSWVYKGGIADEEIQRTHDFNDAMFIPGVRSQPNVLKAHENNGIRLRNKNGDKYIWLKNDGTAEINVDTLKIKGDIDSEGDITSKGAVNSEGDITSKGAINSEGDITSKGAINSEGDITSKGAISSEGDITSKGNIDVTGGITATQDVTAGSISLKTHTHAIRSGSSAGTTSGPL